MFCFMKLSSIALLATLSAGTDAQDSNDTSTTETEKMNPCVICPGGLTVSENLEIDRGTTCGSLVASVLALDASSDSCASSKMAEGLCCPILAQDPCPFCSKGLPVGLSGSQSALCEYNKFASPFIEVNRTECSEIKDTESDCCPALTEFAENPCIVCPEGLTVDEGFDIGKGITCGSLVASALGYDADEKICSNTKAAEAVCCASPCPVCPAGLSVDESVVISEKHGTTCGGLVIDALNTEKSSKVCSNMMKAADSTCCPTEPGTSTSLTTPPANMSISPAPEDDTSANLSTLPTTTLMPASESNTPVNASVVPTTIPAEATIVPVSEDNTSVNASGVPTTISAETTLVPATEDNMSVNASVPTTTTTETTLAPASEGNMPTNASVVLTTTATTTVSPIIVNWTLPVTSPPTDTSVSTASPGATIIESTSSTAATANIESTRSPTASLVDTASPDADTKEKAPIAQPGLAQPTEFNESTCLVASGFLGAMLIPIMSTCYAMALWSL